MKIKQIDMDVYLIPKDLESRFDFLVNWINHPISAQEESTAKSLFSTEFGIFKV
jgi:hypothetical protein